MLSGAAGDRNTAKVPKANLFAAAIEAWHRKGNPARAGVAQVVWASVSARGQR